MANNVCASCDRPYEIDAARPSYLCESCIALGIPGPDPRNARAFIAILGMLILLLLISLAAIVCGLLGVDLS